MEVKQHNFYINEYIVYYIYYILLPNLEYTLYIHKTFPKVVYIFPQIKKG